jgi:hypothetical protein
MASLNSSREFDLLYNHYNEKVPYYFTSAIVLIVVTVFSAVHFGSKKAVAVPSYGLEKHGKDTAKERWMRDAINLVQEGYNKVSSLVCISVLKHEADLTVPRSPVSNMDNGMQPSRAAPTSHR